MPKRIKALRVARKLTQQDVAERANLSLSYVARLEQGKHDPSVGTLRKIAKALGCEPADLLK